MEVEIRAEGAVLEPRRRYQVRAQASRAAMTTAAAAMGAAPVKAAAVVVPVVLEAMAEAGVAMERKVRVVRCVRATEAGIGRWPVRPGET